MAKARKKSKAKRNPVTTAGRKVKYPERCTAAAAERVMNGRKKSGKKISRGTCRGKDASYAVRFGTDGSQYSPKKPGNGGARKFKKGERVHARVNGQDFHGVVLRVHGKVAQVKWSTGVKFYIEIFSLFHSETKLPKKGKHVKPKKGRKGAAKRGAAKKGAAKKGAKKPAKSRTAKVAKAAKIAKQADALNKEIQVAAKKEATLNKKLESLLGKDGKMLTGAALRKARERNRKAQPGVRPNPRESKKAKKAKSKGALATVAGWF